MPTSQEFRELSVKADVVDESSAPAQVIGRDELVEALWVQVKSGSTRLSAPRRIGKTWFLNLALAMRPEWAGPTLFNAGACRSLREFVWELTRHLHEHGYVPDHWEEQVQHWYTQRPATAGNATGLGAEDDWEFVLSKTCGILMEKGAADCPVLMVDELPVFLDTLVGEWAEAEAGRLLEALHRLRVQYPALRMILSDAQGLQRVVDKLRRSGFEGQPLEDLPPFELPALSSADARYLAGCLLLGEQVACTDIHAVAGAVAEACKYVPSAIRNTVDWMARFSEGLWSPDRVAEIPATRDLEEEDRSEPGTLEEHLSLFGPEDLVQPEPEAKPPVIGTSDRVANGGFATLFPFSLDAISDNSALAGGRQLGDPPNEAENRSIVAGPLAAHGNCDPLDPASKSFDWLDGTLSVPHRKIVMDVRTVLARGAQSGAPHHIVLSGPAGSGKSHTLAILAKGFAKGLGLSGRPRRVIYLTGFEQAAESPFDLLLACMQSDNRANDRLRARLDSAAPESRFDELMTAFRERFGNQCTLVVLEELGTLLRNWNKAALDALRLFLDRHPSVILVGTAGPEPLDTGRFQGWLRERFRSCAMPALDGDASRDLLCSLAAARGDRALAAALREPQRAGVIQTIHTLSGGNCRVLASLDRCLSVKGLNALAEPVLQMTRGDLAPAYERRLGDRPPQQYKILQALAEHQGRAVNVTELARYMFLTPQAVSRQLQELLRAGFLVRTQVGREICYELRDPLIRFALDLKHGRENALPLLVRVIRRWCEVERLRRSEDHGFPFAEAFRYEGQIEVTFAMGTSDDSPAAVVALGPESGQQIEKRSERTVSRQLPLGSPELRGADMERQICALGDATETGFAVIFRAAGLLAQDRNHEGLAALDDWLRSSAAAKMTATNQMMAHATRVYALLMLGRYDGAAAAAESVQRLTGIPDTPAVRECIAMTRINQGVAYLKLARFDAAATVFDEVVQQSDPVQLPEMIAAALLNRAAALERLNRYAEAMAALDLVSEQYRHAVHGSLRYVAATARVAKAALLERLGQLDEALAACDDALLIRPGHTRALVMRALFLCRAGTENELFRAVEAAVAAAGPAQAERAILAAELFERVTGAEATVQVAAAIFGRDRTSLLHGLILWTQRQIGVSEIDIRRTERRLHTLRGIFDDDSEAMLVLTMADTLARMKQGDTRAALDLPVELRRLTAGAKG